ncbi:serine/threonine-protein kinase [Thermomonospora cellulosilytica]|uniref:Serine/threonine protein kinase n=1 Tax=Thermomonospora cellulosilytica TaxID=1411118 RepID=A0A7W3R997_9ACTN|nr:serine/threonine-protein kinase [Thermomonospora cellulosilytica]MBA9004532.1 serine/threonine protein kinase [Thermomonospora cellulosilytica]
MPDAAPLEAGDPRRLGNYEVVGRLGAGGQGAVYLGRAEDGTYVAVKLLHAQMAADPSARARFAREVAAAQKVAPFCTARVLQADVAGDTPFIVSEFIDGPSLHDVVAHNGPLGTTELERLAIGTVTALAAIHEAGIVHRDFKPNNVLLAADGPRVVDFGIARTVNSQESAVTATGMVVGTPGYLAPEQLTGAPLQPAVDIFAWGATMVFAATGQSPFEAETLPVIINRILNEEPDLSALQEPLRGLVARCLSKDPAGRPTAAQLLLQLLGHVGAAPATPTPVSEELLGEGTRIASRMAPPPPVPPAPVHHTPPPQPITPPPMPMHVGPQPGPATPPPQPITPPPMPMHQGGFQQGPMTPPPQPMHQPPMTPQPPPYQPARPSSGGGGGNVILGVGCAVVLVLALLIFVVAVAVSGGDDGDDDGTDVTRPTVDASVPTAPSNERLPLEFIGVWEGRGYQPSSTSDKFWDVRFTLLSSTGLVTYDADSYDCTGTLTLQPGVTDTKAVYRISITSGPCLEGYVTFYYISQNRLRFEERETLSGEAISSGTLTK